MWRLFVFFVVFSLNFATTLSDDKQQREVFNGRPRQPPSYPTVSQTDLKTTSSTKQNADNATAPADVDERHLMTVLKLNNTTTVGKLRTKVLEWMKKPYVHGIVFPAIVGIACAFVSVLSLLCIRSCVKAQVKKRRRRRIRNLADDLKTDKTMLLGDSSDDDF